MQARFRYEADLLFGGPASTCTLAVTPATAAAAAAVAAAVAGAVPAAGAGARSVTR